MGDDSEWLKLPTDEKCQHKAWKARLTGYEEATKLFQRLDNEKDPEFSKYLGLIKKFVTDSNAVAQEKALEAVVVYVENAAVAGKTCGDVMSGILTKCFNASKQKTKEKAMEITMLYIEIDKQEIVQDTLMGGLENKQPKVVVGCITALREALRSYGNKVIMIKPMVKVLPKLLEDRDKNVRDETKQLIIEIYRWVGAALRPQLSHFKPVQVQELEAEFEKLPSEKAQQTRFMRSQQDLKAKMEEQAEASAAAGGGSEAVGEDVAPAEDMDPYELMEAVDILAMLPKDFYEKLEAKKWQERKESLEALEKLCQNPKLEQGDYGQLIRCLLKVIAKDTNVMLVALGGKCLAAIAKGLRKKFQPYAVQSISTILDKFKEKKPAVVAALRDAIDSCFAATTLDPISEDCIAALENKNPSIKAETASFLARAFARCTQSSLPKKMLKAFCAPLLKTVNDTAPEVREGSFQALGTAMKVVTEKNIQVYLVDVDSLKMQKIQECCQNAVLLNAKGEPRNSGAAVAKPAAAAAASKPVEQKPAAKVTKPASKSGEKISGAKKVVGGKGKGKKAAGGDKDEATEPILSDEAVEEKAGAILPGDTVTNLTSANWKERLASCEKIIEVLKCMSKEEIPTQALIRTLSKKPGLKDTNFQVLKLKLDIVVTLAQNSIFTKRSAEFCVTEIVDKVGDVKNGGTAKDALIFIAESTSLDYLSKEVMKIAFEQKNPKNQSEALNWLAKAVTEFGLKLNMKAILENIKKALAATNPAVRTSAISLLGIVYMYMGAQLRIFFEDEKPALLQQIDAEFEKVKGEKPPAPIRGLAPAGEGGDDDEEEEAEAEAEVNVADLVPRNDIGDKFTESLIAEMNDKNWKVRKEALDKVVAILNEAKFVTGNLGPLPEALKTRLGDANKILVTTSINICNTLATALGPHCKPHMKTIGAGLMSCLGDSKPHLRAAAVTALKAWLENSSLVPLVENETIFDTLKVENPFLRQELLGWLSEVLPQQKTLPSELKMCVPVILTCLEDRNADVRKKAQDSLVPFMIHVGFDSFFKALSKMKPASKDQILPILEKARANVPAKPTKAKKQPAAAAASAPAASAPSAPQSKSSSKKDDDDESAAKAVTKTSKTKPGKAPPPTKKKKEDEDSGPPICSTTTKEQRFKDEKQLKVLKWNFTEPRLEYVEQIRGQMEKNFNKALIDQLFHNDFKSHIKAITTLISCITKFEEESVNNLDLILKWLTLRFFDTNPSMLNKALEYLQKLFAMLSDRDYHLSELEGSSFIPYLVLKVGDSKDNVRKEVRKIFTQIGKIYPSSKMFSYILDGLKSKNAKQRTECLDELGKYIENFGVTVCQPSPGQALKLIAQQISDRDNSVRNAALNTVVIAFLILGEEVFKYTGPLNDKDQSLLEERIKRTLKNKAKNTADERPKTAPSTRVTKAHSTNDLSRPETAGFHKSSSANVRKEFALELEDEEKPEYTMPKLIQHDLDDIFDPVELPKIKARLPSPSLKLVNPSDASATVGLVVSQVTNADISTCIKALAQIDEVLKDEARAEVLVSHVDQLLLTISMQFKMALTKHTGNENTQKEDVIKLYRCLLGTLLALFQNQTLVQKTQRDVLKDLVNSLLSVLLDNRLSDFDEGPQVIRSVNVMVVKIVEKADCTSITSALMKLLQDCLSGETCSAKFLELIMKCLWKIARMLPSVINDIQLDKVLLDIHIFLKTFPSTTWKTRPNDLPLRTIKTILHSLAKLKGVKILSHMSLIEDGENSELTMYLKKVLKNENSSHSEDVNSTPEDNKSSKNTSKSKRLSKSTHDMLADIFKKIGSKENTREGLNDLYDFKKRYPEADLAPFLKKSSQFFQSYIERGLKNIEMEREGKKNMVNTGSSIGTVSSQGSDSSTGDGDGTSAGNADYYKERLKVLRATCGLENIESTKKEEEVPVIETPDVEEVKIEEVEPSNEPSQAVSTANVLELKKRLERIKKLAKSNTNLS